MKTANERFEFRKIRTRRNIFGSPDRPRLSVYKSLKYIYAQVIDDVKSHTLAAASSKEKGFPKETGIKAAKSVGGEIGKRALKKGITSVVFDRGARRYTGQLKALADGAREAGLKF